jgi:DNA-binding NarL/FixJ family response regulator
MTCPLTQAQMEILRQIAEGKTHEEIANNKRHPRAYTTVKNTVYAALQRTNTNHAIQLVALALVRGWLKPSEIKIPQPQRKLTPTQLERLRRLALGEGYKEIAYNKTRRRSRHTIKNSMSDARKRAGMNTVQLIVTALVRGWIEINESDFIPRGNDVPRVAGRIAPTSW